MKRMVILFSGILIIVAPMGLHARQAVGTHQSVPIERVIINTRSELGQLASSEEAQQISDLMKQFDKQYKTWSVSCGAESFDPNHVSDACKAMAGQMRETGIKLYEKLSEYLPDVAARYEQGARSAKNIVQSQALDQTPAELYTVTMNGVSETPNLEELTAGDSGSPFDLEMGEFPDPAEEMFISLEKLVPDFGEEIPETVRAGNAQVNMMKKANRARHLAKLFEKASLALESQREYGKIIFSATEAVTAMPKVLGIQYTPTRLSARPNQKVLDYYRNKKPASEASPSEEEKTGGFERRT